jgi:hypothetical protein
MPSEYVNIKLLLGFFFAFIFHQVVLKRLDAAEGQVDTEIVHAKFVVGADGWSF